MEEKGNLFFFSLKGKKRLRLRGGTCYNLTLNYPKVYFSFLFGVKLGLEEENQKFVISIKWGWDQVILTGVLAFSSFYFKLSQLLS